MAIIVSHSYGRMAIGSDGSRVAIITAAYKGILYTLNLERLCMARGSLASANKHFTGKEELGWGNVRFPGVKSENFNDQYARNK